MNLLKLLLPAVLALAPIAAGAQTLDKIKESGTLTIAFDPNVPPWSYKDDKLQYAGYEFMVAKKLAEDHGLKLEIVETNGANRIPLLMTQKVDLVVAAMTINDERKKVITFSLPYAGAETAVSAPADVAIAKPEDLSGKSIAVARGTIMDDQVTAIAPPDAQIVRFEDEATTQTAVLSGQMDLIAQNVTRNKSLMDKQPGLKLEPKIILGTGMHGIGMRKGEDDLKAWVDVWVQENMKNGTLDGFYQQVHGTAMPKAVQDAAIAGQDQ
ncbi:transporter substrate-binding domain-containing protein [Paracoccus litorisediminis]|uniref:transporter substrate-binding domain-containing protein n=1 Tax=Paracoccus litorisediminis TaxID=2006130 RepID=UPI00372F3252